jgi:hypothetical protein
MGRVKPHQFAIADNIYACQFLHFQDDHDSVPQMEAIGKCQKPSWRWVTSHDRRQNFRLSHLMTPLQINDDATEANLRVWCPKSSFSEGMVATKAIITVRNCRETEGEGICG